MAQLLLPYFIAMYTTPLIGNASKMKRFPGQVLVGGQYPSHVLSFILSLTFFYTHQMLQVAILLVLWPSSSGYSLMLCTLQLLTARRVSG